MIVKLIEIVSQRQH